MRGKSTKWIIGIDEAGRGPLAGPIVVAGIRISATTSNSKFKTQNAKFRRVFKGIKDSKKLSPKQREEWYKVLTRHPKIEWAVAKVYPKTIDRINISAAANFGAYRIWKKLTGRSGVENEMFQLSSGRVIDGTFACRVLLDGSLYLPAGIPHKTIIKGDEKIPVISAASIIAKVTRDRIMFRLHKKYPQYGFDVHKGYGTKLHRKMVKRFGRTEVHRKSFQFDPVIQL